MVSSDPNDISKCISGVIGQLSVIFNKCIKLFVLGYFCSAIAPAIGAFYLRRREVMLEINVIESKMYELARSIDYLPNNINYLTEAMHCQIIHSESDGKNRKNYTNDSLATLGDSLLKFILTEYLFDKDYDKADITTKKQQLEDNTTLFNLCNDSGIFRYAYNGSYFSDNAPLENQVHHSKHDVYIEAIIAAIYKDKGFEYCKKWTISFF